MDHSTTKKPAVSIALCTFNGAGYLKQQIESIQSQTYDNITEIICVDDGSKDDTIEILQKCQTADSRIKVFINETNLGYIKNFEKALNLCNESFIALSDQDDLWYPNKVERLMESIENNLMVYSDTEYIDENNKKLNRKISDFRHLGVCKTCLNSVLFNGIAGHTMLIKKELIKMSIPFSPKVPHDHWISFFAAKYGSMAFVDEVLVGYRQHAENAFGGFGMGSKKKDPKIETYERLAAFAETIDDSFAYEKSIILNLKDIYKDMTFRKRVEKVHLFLKHKDELLFFKKRNRFRKTIYCFHMFCRVI